MKKWSEKTKVAEVPADAEVMLYLPSEAIDADKNQRGDVRDLFPTPEETTIGAIAVFNSGNGANGGRGEVIIKEYFN